MSKKFKSILTTILFSISFCTTASELPDPELLAKQYIKDLCTLDEQDFVRKYMLTQADVEFMFTEMTAAYEKINSKMPEGISDSLLMRNKVQQKVVRSYRKFKEWQYTNKIDSSKVRYHSCEFELEKKRDMPFYSTGITEIYFTVDTLNYVMVCDNFGFVKDKWLAGDIEDIDPLNKSFERITRDFTENGYLNDTAVVAPYNENYSDYLVESPVEEVLSKRQLKIQKKIDVYSRKIGKLYAKMYAWAKP